MDGAADQLMLAALEQARRSPELPFGAVLVERRTGTIVATGVNRTADSPTYHAEIDAINRCAAADPGVDWSELALVTTAEPCPMCQAAIELAGIREVYFGTSIPWLIAQGWWQLTLRAAEVAARAPGGGARIVGGVRAAECNALFEAAGRLNAARTGADRSG